MHKGHEAASVAWPDIENETRLVRLPILAPVDVAIIKVARFSDLDQADTLELVRAERLA